MSSDRSAFLEALLALGQKAVADAPLRRHSTLRVGGNADVLVRVESADELSRLQSLAADHAAPITLIGLGSNVVVPDAGVRGVVVKLGGDLAVRQVVSQVAGEALVEVGAGAVNAHTVRDLHALGLVGAEFLALVPGTMGGAVVMNAGTRWGELSEVLESVTIVTGDGSSQQIHIDDLAIGYRHTTLPEGAIVTSAVIRVHAGDATEAADRVRAEKRYREQTQPYKLATNGSVFANPEGDAAGRLIDVCGLKRQRDGDAVISEKHANWIVNTTGDATAANVLRLMHLAREAVRDRFGIELRPEVRLLGGGDVLDAMARASLEEAEEDADREKVPPHRGDRDT